MLCLVVRTLSAQTCVFIFRVFAAGHTDSYNIRETDRNEGTIKWKILNL